MKNFTPFPCRTDDAILMVTSYQEGELSGVLVHPRLEGPRKIRSVPQLLFLLDEFLLREEGLISYHAFEPTGFSEIQRIATLRIRILFRENHTWQGCVMWEEQRKEASFRSVLELIQLLDEILEG